LAALYVDGAGALISGTVIRDTGPSVQQAGFAVATQPNLTTGATAPVVIQRSLLTGNAGMGVYGKGLDLTVEDTVIRDTAASSSDGSGPPGRGLTIQAEETTSTPASLVLRGALIEGSRQAGVVVTSATATVEGSVVRATRLDDVGFGDGFFVVRLPAFEASATVTNTRVDDNERAAIATFAGAVAITKLRATCNVIDINGEAYGGQDHVVTDGGDSLCGCPEADQACAVVTLGLEPTFE
jgi:hypothetical protein